ncbi:MAG TPA: hypothetical protein VIV60_21715 [Polyangiaceae bacterium]
MKEKIETLRSLVTFAYEQGFHEIGYDIVSEIESKFDRINMLACYASEEDTSAQADALLIIGQIARDDAHHPHCPVYEGTQRGPCSCSSAETDQ